MNKVVETLESIDSVNFAEYIENLDVFRITFEYGVHPEQIDVVRQHLPAAYSVDRMVGGAPMNRVSIICEND